MNVRPPPPDRHPVAGWAMVGLGVLTAAAVYAHPEGLRAPAWVAYLACAAFVVAGLTRLAYDAGRPRLHHAMGVVLVGAMTALPLWVAFGPGERSCRIAGPFSGLLPPETLCRAGFGLGAAMMLGVFAWAVQHALRAGQSLNR